jgi:hypothetical protein
MALFIHHCTFSTAHSFWYRFYTLMIRFPANVYLFNSDVDPDPDLLTS